MNMAHLLCSLLVSLESCQMSDDVMVLVASKAAEGPGGLGARGTAALMRMGKTDDPRQL